jgi:hypothetical protein
MLVIGSNELGKPVKKGDTVESKSMGKSGVVELGKNELGEESGLMQFVTVYGASYLVGINGRLLGDWVVIE